MSKKYKLFLVGVMAMLASACSHVSQRYSASASNVEQIRELTKGSTTKIDVAQFTATEKDKKSIVCRAEGAVSPPDNKTYEAFIRDALSDELRVAGLYDAKSLTKLQGNLDYINFSSNIGAGKWMMKMTFNGDGIEPFSIDNTYEFSTNFVAGIACEQVAQALTPATQDFIKKLIQHPSFIKLTGTKQ